MRCFVVGTGRCGTSTFYNLALTLNGYTVGHETKAGRALIPEYSDNHIEVDHELSYLIPLLKDRYPDARFVHLVREREACVESLVRETWDRMEAFSFAWFQSRHPWDVVAAARIYYDATNRLIEEMAPAMTIPLAELREAWPGFCALIGAEWDWPEAERVLSRRYNAAGHRGRDNFVEA